MMSATAKRERKFKRTKLRALPKLRRLNSTRIDERSAAIEQMAYEAVQSVFGWLAVDTIKNPPRKLMDAKFARQVAIHLMTTRALVPQREVARLQRRQRTSIHFALRAVDERLEEPVFTAAYERMAERLAQRMAA